MCDVGEEMRIVLNDEVEEAKSEDEYDDDEDGNHTFIRKLDDLINPFEDAKSDQFFPQKNKQRLKKKQNGNAVARIQITLSEPPSGVV